MLCRSVATDQVRGQLSSHWSMCFRRRASSGVRAPVANHVLDEESVGVGDMATNVVQIARDAEGFVCFRHIAHNARSHFRMHDSVLGRREIVSPLRPSPSPARVSSVSVVCSVYSQATCNLC